MKSTARAFGVVGAVILLAVGHHAAPAQERGDPPEGGTPLLPTPAQEAFTLRSSAEGAAAEVVETTGMPFTKAIRVRVPAAGKKPYDIELKATTIGPIRKGDVLWLSFWWRAAPSTDSEFEAVTRVYVSKSSPPWTTLHSQSLGAKSEWRRIQIPFIANESLAAGEAQVTFHLAFCPQTVEFGGMTLLNFGPNFDIARLPRNRETYAGREPDAPWRADALARIERIRKGDLTVRVVKADGRPASGATVSAVQRRSAFGFGTMVTPDIFHGQPLKPSRGNPGYNPTPEDFARYRQSIERYFNLVTPGAALVYNGWMGGRSPDEALNILRWARERGFQTRGHFLIQPDQRSNRWFTPLFRHADEPEVYRRLEDFIRRAVPATRDLVDYWDGINHAGRWIPESEETISVDFQARALRLAKELNPDIRLFVTENFILSGGDTDTGTRRALFEAKILALKERGAPIDGIAFQGHFDYRLTSPPKLLELMDRFGRHAPLLQITEYDIAIADEDLAADYTRDLLIAAFSHPQMNAFQMWGFWDADHWKSNAPMFRRDWSLKPAGAVWIEWVTRRWRTNAEGTADEVGVFRLRGFHGDYEIQAEANGRRATATASLMSEKTEILVRLPEPGTP